MTTSSIYRHILPAVALLAALVTAPSVARSTEEIPIVFVDGGVDICDEDAVVVIIDDDNVYIEVETTAGTVEWHVVPDRRIGYSLAQGDVLTEIVGAGGRNSVVGGLFVSVNRGRETELTVSDGLGDFNIASPRSSYGFDWRLDSTYTTPATPDVVFEPSTVCPPPKLDDDQEQ
jgi:hypothetical protein